MLYSLRIDPILAASTLIVKAWTGLGHSRATRTHATAFDLSVFDYKGSFSMDNIDSVSSRIAWYHNVLSNSVVLLKIPTQGKQVYTGMASKFSWKAKSNRSTAIAN